MRGHKVFVYRRGEDGVILEAVTDTDPVVRLTFDLEQDEADEIAAMLTERDSWTDANAPREPSKSVPSCGDVVLPTGGAE